MGWKKLSFFHRDNFLRLQIFYEDLSVFKIINEEAYKVNLLKL